MSQPVVAASTQLEIPKSAMAKRGSLTSAKSLHELKQDRGSIDDAISNQKKAKERQCDDHNDTECVTCNNEITEANKPAIGLRPSKSDTSITDSFVVVDNDYNKKKGRHSLRTGMCVF